MDYRLATFLLVTFFKLYYRIEHVKGDDVSFTVLIPSFHYDYQLVVEMEETLENFKAMPAEVLLIGGSKSPNFLKHTLDELDKYCQMYIVWNYRDLVTQDH